MSLNSASSVGFIFHIATFFPPISGTQTAAPPSPDPSKQMCERKSHVSSLASTKLVETHQLSSFPFLFALSKRCPPQVEQKYRTTSEDEAYAVSVLRSTVGAGIGECMVHSVPCVRRQMLQWQKCVGNGRELVGMVKESLDALQWQAA